MNNKAIKVLVIGWLLGIVIAGAAIAKWGMRYSRQCEQSYQDAINIILENK